MNINENKKIINLAAGIVFLLSALYAAFGSVTAASYGYTVTAYFLRQLPGIVVLALLGIRALQQKPRGKVLNILGIMYLLYRAVMWFSTLAYSFSIMGLITLLLLVAAFLLSAKANNEVIINTKDTASEAAKTQQQSEKQTSLYDEQLKNGILTQEEYDQITKSK